MKVNAKSINLEKIQQEAEESYRKGFFCCEAVAEIIRSNFELDVSEDVIRMASRAATASSPSSSWPSASSSAGLSTKAPPTPPSSSA